VRVFEESAGRSRSYLDLKHLPEMTADELTEALREHFEGIGGLAFEADLAIARELVRRARRLEKLESEGATAAPGRLSPGLS
jgi:hypothetical protein